GPGDTGHHRLAAELALDADLAGDAGHLAREGGELVDHRVDRVLQLRDLAADLDGEVRKRVASGNGGGHLGDVADLAGQVAGELVDVVGQLLPGAGDPGHHRLPAELALGADLARHAGDLIGERAELVDHRVDRVLQLQDLAADVDG